jgi:hypothetical protein
MRYATSVSVVVVTANLLLEEVILIDVNPVIVISSTGTLETLLKALLKDSDSILEITNSADVLKLVQLIICDELNDIPTFILLVGEDDGCELEGEDDGCELGGMVGSKKSHEV